MAKSFDSEVRSAKIENARSALAYYAELVEQQKETLATNLKDLLADLMYLAEYEGIDFNLIHYKAAQYFEDEQ